VSFIQIVEMQTSDVDKLLALDREWEAATEGKRTVRRSIVTRDRARPDRYLVIAFFDSYEAAQANSNLPETREYAERYAGVVDGPVDFRDLDVIEERA
jgi:quinol monooxygenase YgiN